METIITPGVRDNESNTHADSEQTHVNLETIQVVTSISDAIVLDDGSITPTAATVIDTSVFENGVLAGSIQQDPSRFYNGGGISSTGNEGVAIHHTLVDVDRLDVVVGPGSGSTTRSSGTNSTSPERDQQQTQQQQQQRQRELHYESANAVLVPPLNFALVAPGVYRSGHPNKHNFPFMRKLGLKVIVQMSEEPYAPDLEEFLDREKIRRIHYKIEGNKEPFIEIDEQVISSALVNILGTFVDIQCYRQDENHVNGYGTSGRNCEERLDVSSVGLLANRTADMSFLLDCLDARNHPLLIHCAKGKHRIGCLIGCLRKIQNWSMTSIFDEYRRFAGSKVLADQEFIEIFSAKVPYSLEHKPFWL